MKIKENEMTIMDAINSLTHTVAAANILGDSANTVILTIRKGAIDIHGFIKDEHVKPDGKFEGMAYFENEVLKETFFEDMKYIEKWITKNFIKGE
ncbi:MAG: hypothetical protein ACRDDY_02740 [Clostridium sp.]|uniref:hypothetical protein n=1 Tax=Clostridium sp. TaxID=1506 RepID=UPI003EE46B5D